VCYPERVGKGARGFTRVVLYSCSEQAIRMTTPRGFVEDDNNPRLLEDVQNDGMAAQGQQGRRFVQA